MLHSNVKLTFLADIFSVEDEKFGHILSEFILYMTSRKPLSQYDKKCF